MAPFFRRSLSSYRPTSTPPPSSSCTTYLLILPSITSFVPLFLPGPLLRPFLRLLRVPSSNVRLSYLLLLLPRSTTYPIALLLLPPNPYLHFLLPHLPSPLPLLPPNTNLLLPLLPPSLYLSLFNLSFTFLCQNDKDGDGWGDACDLDRD